MFGEAEGDVDGRARLGARGAQDAVGEGEGVGAEAGANGVFAADFEDAKVGDLDGGRAGGAGGKFEVVEHREGAAIDQGEEGIGVDSLSEVHAADEVPATVEADKRGPTVAGVARAHMGVAHGV